MRGERRYRDVLAECPCHAAGLSILADACMGLGCDEQLEPQADRSPFKPLEPLSVLPDLGPDSPDLLHLSSRRPQASAPAYPCAALAQRILGERSEPPALTDAPAEVATTAFVLTDPGLRLSLWHDGGWLHVPPVCLVARPPESRPRNSVACCSIKHDGKTCVHTAARLHVSVRFCITSIEAERVRHVQVQAHMRPHMGAPDGADAAVAPVELLCAEADHALQQLQGNNPSSSWTSSSSEDTPSLPPAQDGEDENSSISSSKAGMVTSTGPDEQSMWVDEQIAEAEFLQQLEDSDSPVEATAQLSLPMFPDLAGPEAPSEDQLPPDNSGDRDSKSRESKEHGETAGKAVGHTSSKAAQGLVLNSAASMPELDENFVTPAGSPRKQAASAPPVLDLRFARSDSLSSAASHPVLDHKKHPACRGSGGLRLTHLVCRLSFPCT